jgi:hypothetical protein
MIEQHDAGGNLVERGLERDEATIGRFDRKRGVGSRCMASTVRDLSQPTTTAMVGVETQRITMRSRSWCPGANMFPRPAKCRMEKPSVMAAATRPDPVPST